MTVARVFDDSHGPARPIAPIGERDFHRIRDLVAQDSGVHLSNLKRELVTARLSRRIRTLGLRGFRDYVALVTADAAERIEMLDRILTNETRFFREPRQIEYLEQTIGPQWRDEARTGQRPRALRLWSAGCSTGQEPATLAMVLLAALPGWNVEILASDLSSRALAQAASGVFPIEKANEIPEHYRKEFVLRGVRSEAGRMRLADNVRTVIRYRRINLNMPLPDGAFDLIFCRNVLIYFDTDSRRRAIERLMQRLVPAGYFFLGHSESLINATQRLRPVAPSIYRSEPKRA